jgi:adenylate cyclase
MAEEHVERRLTTILAADVAGYSRLMGDDEEGTLAQLKVHRRELVRSSKILLGQWESTEYC